MTRITAITANIPEEEVVEFSAMAKALRTKMIRPAAAVVKEIFLKNPQFKDDLVVRFMASETILAVREMAWKEFLIEEAIFTAAVIKEVGEKYTTPSSILNILIAEIKSDAIEGTTEEKIREAYGVYSGGIMPFIYALSLSNTQSRRSRAGSTFEAIIYQVYDYLGYPYDSQKKAAKKLFEQVNLGKKIDSVLPSVEFFQGNRTNSIIGTMKTSLRERWQEVAEEMVRASISVIHLLTVDMDIPAVKAQAMAKHNIIVVAPKQIADSPALAKESNVISFEEYLFQDIPEKMKRHWPKEVA